MNTKYLVGGVLVVIISVFYFIHQSNKASAEKRQQEMIAYQQKIEREQLEEVNKKKAIELKQAEAEKEKAIRVKQDQAKNEASIKEFAKKAEAEKAAIIKKAEDTVKSRLIDPDSAKFQNQKGNCGEVNAKNKLGGYTGYSRYIYDPKTNHAVVESDASTSIITPKIMNSLWEASCN